MSCFQFSNKKTNKHRFEYHWGTQKKNCHVHENTVIRRTGSSEAKTSLFVLPWTEAIVTSRSKQDFLHLWHKLLSLQRNQNLPTAFSSAEVYEWGCLWHVSGLHNILHSYRRARNIRNLHNWSWTFTQASYQVTPWMKTIKRVGMGNTRFQNRLQFKMQINNFE